MEKKTYRFWSPELLKELEEFCRSGQCSSVLGTAKKFHQAHPERSVNAIRMKIIEHPEWMKHFEKQETESREDSLSQIDEYTGISQEEFEKKSQILFEILKRGPTTLRAVSEDPRINIPKEAVFSLADKLREQGHDVVIEEDKKSREWRIFLQHPWWPTVKQSLPPIAKRNRIEVLFTEGPCFGLKTQQGDLFATALAIGEQREVFLNVILGNLVAGVPPKAKRDEYFLTTVDEQAEYVVSRFPRAPFNSFLLNGPRELSFRKRGENIESLICSERDDIRYVGDEKAFIPIGRNNAKVAIVSHEAQAYTKSYPLQGIAENFQEAVHYVHEHSEPFRSLIVGGLHSGILLPRQLPISPERYNDFDMVTIPTLHRLTASQAVSRRRGASPVLGCMVLGANFTDKGKFSGFTYAFYDLTAYFKSDDYLEGIDNGNLEDNLSDEAKKILSFLQKRPARPGELSRLIRRAIKKRDNGGDVGLAGSDGTANLQEASVEEAIDELRNAGFKIEFNKVRKAYEFTERRLKKEFKALDLERLFRTRVRLLLTSDWHVGHYGERPDLIKKVFEIAQDRKVDLITCSGNLFEGYGSYSGQELDVTQEGKGADAQRDHLLEILPKSNIDLVVIGSPLREHDGVFWVRAGHDIVDTFAKMARLLGYRVTYLKTSQKTLRQKGAHGTFTLKGLKFDVQHPKGGLPYGQTYRIQRRLEMLVSYMNLSSGAKATFIGHLHRAAFMLYKGMAGFLVPCLKDSPEDEYITALDKVAELGAWIVEMAFDEFKNLTKVELEYIPFEPRPEYIRHVNMDDVIRKWEVKKRK